MDWRRKHTAAGESGRPFRNSAYSCATPSTTPFVVTAFSYGLLLLVYHVKADAGFEGTYGDSSDAAPFHQRVQTGPFGLSNVDLILFGAFILLAFETLQFLVQGSGSTCFASS
jgi:hypothetical protein